MAVYEGLICAQSQIWKTSSNVEIWKTMRDRERHSSFITKNFTYKQQNNKNYYKTRSIIVYKITVRSDLVGCVLFLFMLFMLLLLLFLFCSLHCWTPTNLYDRRICLSPPPFPRIKTHLVCCYFQERAEIIKELCKESGANKDSEGYIRCYCAFGPFWGILRELW